LFQVFSFFYKVDGESNFCKKWKVEEYIAFFKAEKQILTNISQGFNKK